MKEIVNAFVRFVSDVLVGCDYFKDTTVDNSVIADFLILAIKGEK